MIVINEFIGAIYCRGHYAVVVVLLSLWPMWIWKKSWARLLSALIIFPLAAHYINYCGLHFCDEGNPPLFMVLTYAGAAALGPFCVRLCRWRLPLYVFLMTIAGIATSMHLAGSYHRQDITGNPAYSSGQFWHTPFTGQYPRDPKYWFFGPQPDQKGLRKTDESSQQPAVSGQKPKE